jgi:deoxyribodipyrimidine photo-lyase
MQKIGVWFTNNLRISDNTLFFNAQKSKWEILPFYVFDTEESNKTHYGFRKIGKYRAQFLIESLENLRSHLNKVGSNIKILKIPSKTSLIDTLSSFGFTSIYIQEPVWIDEKKYVQNLALELQKKWIRLILVWDHTLIHPSDLPFSIHELPKIFTEFRKQVEKNLHIESPLSIVTPIKTMLQDNWWEIPSLSDFWYEHFESDARSVLNFKWGEDEAQKRLKHYLWDSNSLAKYKETRNGLIGPDYSSKFSPWLAHGCISPRQIYAEVKKYEKNRVKNDSTYWLVFELLWRDFFQFVMLQNPMIFFSDFPEERFIYKNQNEKNIFEKWREGKLLVPFVDANMKELKHTGFMSNRGRQNVASYLKNDLKLDWRLGAMYFEQELIDYDVASNWGNWAYVAGVGNDPRDNRYFNIERQQSMYDSEGKYRELWKIKTNNT